MPSSRRHHPRPVIVELTPGSVASASNIAPSTPPSPKQVRFAPNSCELVSGISRPPTQTEAWSLYHFENHARQCPTCYNPDPLALPRQRLCPTGHSLAQDLAIHAYHHAGQVYSTKQDDHKPIRVEIQLPYTQVRAVLRSMDRARSSTHRTAPIISYDQTYPISARRPTPQPEPEYSDRADLVIEPTPSSSRKEPIRSKHKSKRYSTTVVVDDVEATASARRKEQRGSLYDKDTQRPRRDYVVEVREPRDEERKARRRREERKSEYYS